MIGKVTFVALDPRMVSKDIIQATMQGGRPSHMLKGLRQRHLFGVEGEVILDGFSKDHNEDLLQSFAIFQMNIGGIPTMQIALLPRHDLLGTIPGLQILSSCPY